MTVSQQTARPRPKQGSPLLYFLGFVTVVFMGILVFAYIVTKRTHPVYLDEHGSPVNSAPAQRDSQAK